MKQLIYVRTRLNGVTTHYLPAPKAETLERTPALRQAELLDSIEFHKKEMVLCGQLYLIELAKNVN